MILDDLSLCKKKKKNLSKKPPQKIPQTPWWTHTGTKHIVWIPKYNLSVLIILEKYQDCIEKVRGGF